MSKATCGNQQSEAPDVASLIRATLLFLQFEPAWLELVKAYPFAHERKANSFVCERQHHREPLREKRPRAALAFLPYSITSSASASSVGGMSRPSALAVFRLMMNSNFVACKIGRSAGFSPLRIRAA
jgi:hypothetical protein